MEGFGTMMNCLSLGIDIPIIGLFLLTNYVIAAIVRRWGYVGEIIRRSWLIFSLVASAAMAWYVVMHLAPWN
jgi:hypothetical protein